MSEPIQIPSKLKLQSSNQGSAAGSPLEVARVGIAPTSFTTRRTRTTSVTKKIDEKDLEDGTGLFSYLIPLTCLKRITMFFLIGSFLILIGEFLGIDRIAGKLFHICYGLFWMSFPGFANKD